MIRAFSAAALVALSIGCSNSEQAKPAASLADELSILNAYTAKFEALRSRQESISSDLLAAGVLRASYEADGDAAGVTRCDALIDRLRASEKSISAETVDILGKIADQKARVSAAESQRAE